MIHNIIAGNFHESNVVILAPQLGPFASRFIECGAAVRTGNLFELLNKIRDVFCIICNTIMTAQYVVELSKFPHCSIIWIIHEWWTDEMISENLSIRNVKGMTLQTVHDAFSCATHIVFVCESQRKLYSPISSSSSVIYIGVPAPAPPVVIIPVLIPAAEKKLTFNFLSLGIVCPRKNQLWAVHLFKQFAIGRDDARLIIVGARHSRKYEVEYLKEVQAAINGDPKIELHDVTTNVDRFYAAADAFLFTSTNEVTPLVILESMSYGIPVITTNIAGIPEVKSCRTNHCCLLHSAFIYNPFLNVFDITW